MSKNYRFDTQLIHPQSPNPNQHGALASPLYQTSTFTFDSIEQGAKRFAGEESGYIYTRLGNPTVRELELKMAQLEGSDDAAATATGMAAVSSTLLANLQAGDHMIAANGVYGCTYSLLTEQLPRFGIEVTFVDMSKLQQVTQAIKPNTKLIFLETPVNPHLQVFNLELIANIAKSNQLISVVDNTFLTPVLQKPIEHGIDIVVHSATKYLNGHGDVIAGVICGEQAQIDLIKSRSIKDFGGSMAPFDAWLITRGLKTLSLRMARHCENSLQVARWLEKHPSITNVYYPGLNEYCGKSLMGSQMKAGGGLLAIELNASIEQTMQFANHLALFKIAVSLGDVESLVQHPASMTHAGYSPEDRQLAGISDGLIRLSIGLEDPADLIADIESALMGLID